jgi:hypothetical protein
MTSAKSVVGAALVGLLVLPFQASPQRTPVTTVPIDRAALADRVRTEFLFAWNAKYLYLLFAPDSTFDNVTFNTEAHPLIRTW